MGTQNRLFKENVAFFREDGILFSPKMFVMLIYFSWLIMAYVHWPQGMKV